MLPSDLKIYESMEIGIIALISGGLLRFVPAGDAARHTPILLEQISILSAVQQFSIQAGWVSGSVLRLPPAPPVLLGPREEQGSPLPPNTKPVPLSPC